MFCLQHCVGLTTKIDVYGSCETSVNIIWFVDQDYFRTNIYSTFNSNWTHFLRKYKPAPVPTAARSKVYSLPLLACWDCGFESRQGHRCMSLISVVCCQEVVSATGRSLVQRSPTDCGASLCLIYKPHELGGHDLIWAAVSKNYIYIYISMLRLKKQLIEKVKIK